MSSGVTSSLFFASMVGRTRVKMGTTSKAITAMCKLMEMICVQPRFSSFVQMSFTFTGFTAKGKGASFGGEKNSLMRVPKPPKLAPHATVSLLLTGPLGAGLELKKSLRLSPIPVPKDVRVNGASLRSRTLTGRSVRNCTRLDQKLSGIRMLGALNFGTAEAGTGTLGSAPVFDTLAFVISGGRRLINLPGTVSLF